MSALTSEKRADNQPARIWRRKVLSFSHRRSVLATQQELPQIAELQLADVQIGLASRLASDSNQLTG